MLISFFLLLISVTPEIPTVLSSGCVTDRVKNTDYVVCRFAGDADFRLFLNDENGKAFRHFNRVNDALAEKDDVLSFAMNAGMYHDDRSPVGYYVEGGEPQKSLNTNDGPGNFHMKPNGVFYVSSNGKVGVADTDRFIANQSLLFKYATQSGPMLVINGEIHPRFIRDSDSRKRRNGVGVSDAGNVVFVLADSPVNFYDFARYFRDVLKTPNALYLDGTISRIYAPEIDRHDPGVGMGPIIGVVEQK